MLLSSLAASPNDLKVNRGDALQNAETTRLGRHGRDRDVGAGVHRGEVLLKVAIQSFLLGAVCLVIGVETTSAQSRPRRPLDSQKVSILQNRLAIEIEEVLASEGIPLRSLSLVDRELTIDIGHVPGSVDSESSRGSLMSSISHRTNDIFEAEGLADERDLDYEILVEGLPLFPVSASRTAQLQISGGSTVVVSPGHGYYQTTSGGWLLQRSFFFGIVEDFINLDLGAQLNQLITAAGMTTRPARELSTTVGTHIASGFPWWQMGGSEYVRSLGAPFNVWNAGFNGMDRDIVSRPEYANWVAADVMISLHNNGGGGCGTETWYDTTNGYQTQSRALADAVHSLLITRLRQQWNANWCDRGVKGSAGGYGENRRFNGPAVIVELAFMDQSSNNSALQNATFRTIAMTAIKDALLGMGLGSTSPTVTINSVSTAPQTVSAGSPFTLQYSITSSATANVMLGASLRPNGTIAWTIDDPPRDLSVSLASGSSTVSRQFLVPGSTAPGSYDAIVAVWRDSNGSGSIDSGDEMLASLTLLGAETVTAPAVNYTVTLSASPGAGGTVSGGGTFAANSSRTVAATANSGYTFANWTESGTVVSSSASYSFTVTTNRSLVANFTVTTAKAHLTTPAPGSTLTASTVTFQWTGGSGVSQYWLYVGGTQGASDLFNQDRGTNLSATVSGLPTDGRTLHVRLWSLIGTGWQFNDYTLTAVTATTAKAQLTSPAPGSTLTASTVAFQWTGGSGVSKYWLFIGSSQGGFDFYSQDRGRNLSATVSGLPPDGRTLHVRLWSLIGGAWTFNDYTLTALTTVTAKAQLTTPAPGSTLTASTVMFQWTGGSGVSKYWLFIGDSPGGSGLVTQDLGLSLSATITGLPTDGRAIYVRLWSLVGAAWQFNDYTFTSVTATAARAELTSPASGATLTSSTVVFQWNGGTGVAKYWLFVGTSTGAADLFNQDRGMALGATIAGLPTDGRLLHVRLWSLIGSAWQFHDYTLTAMTGTTAKAELTTPAPGLTLSASNVALHWTGGAGVARYWLFIGTSTGGADLFNQDRRMSLTATVTGLPTDGRALYVRLWSLIDGTWQFNDYTLTAVTISARVNSARTAGKTARWFAGAATLPERRRLSAGATERCCASYRARDADSF